MAAFDRVGYAVVGLGHFAEQAILPGFHHSQKTKLVAVVSGDARKARRLARKFGALDCFHYDQYGLCLTHPLVETVYIATNNGTHADFAVQAAAAGKHVLCEKPMANDVESCRQMINACRAHHVRLMVAYRKHFDPAALDLKMLVESGRLGRLKIIHSAFSVFLRPGLRIPPWHFIAQQAGGGALVDVGVYGINMVRWLTGREPVGAAAYQWTADPAVFREVDENIMFRLNFPDDLVMHGTASWGAAKVSFLHVMGEKGWATLEPAYSRNEERRLSGSSAGKGFEKKYKIIDEVALELDAFAECVRRNREPEPNGAQGLCDVAIMQAIYQAAREGHPVAIAEP